MTSDNNTQPFHFLLTWQDRQHAGDSNNHYTTFALRPVYLGDDGDARYFGTWDGSQGASLASLEIVASLSCHRSREREEYLSWEIGYRDAYTINLARAEAMVKTLKSINTYLDKAVKRDGLAASFGQYVLRVCRALGAAGILITNEDAREGRTEYWERKNGEVVNSVDFQVQDAKWRAKEAFKNAEALVEAY